MNKYIVEWHELQVFCLGMFIMRCWIKRSKIKAYEIKNLSGLK